MTLQDLLNKLSPINTKEKVDTLILEMKKCGLKMNPKAELDIRCAIQKANIQKYVIDAYRGLFVEKQKPQKVVQNNKKPIEKKTEEEKREEKKKRRAERKKKKTKEEKKEERKKRLEEKERRRRARRKEYLRQVREMPSIMKVFGSKTPKRKKKLYFKRREEIAPHKKEYTTTTKSSLYAIGIAM